MGSMELIYADPATLVIDTNVRLHTDIDPKFFESIRDNGVQTPPIGWRDEHDRIIIETGQRRVTAAVMAKLTQIPVLLKSREDAESENIAEVGRIVRQLSENDHRTGLTDAEHVAAYTQLSLFGLTEDQIAKQTKTKRDRVRAAVKLIKAAPTVADGMATHQATLDQAIIVSEFEGDEERTRQLWEVAESDPDELEFTAQRMRREVAEAAELANEVAKIEADGFRYVADTVRGWDDAMMIHDVLLPDTMVEPTVEEAQARGGLIVSIYVTSRWDREAGHVKHYEREYWIEKPGERGYIDPDADEQAGESPEQGSAREAEAAEQKRVAAEKADREVQWADASKVRERWIMNELLCAKKMPDGAMAMVAAHIVHADGFGVWSHSVVEVAGTVAGWLGISYDAKEKPQDKSPFLEYADAKGGQEAWRVPLGMALEGQEAKYRRYLDASYSSVLLRCARYLLQLSDWGHTLSAIEKRIVNDAAELQDELAIDAAA